MSNKKVYAVSIAVFKSVPQDYRKKRHVATWCEPEGGGSKYFFKAVGSSKAYVFNARVDYNLMASLRFAKLIRVGNFQKAMTPNELNQEMRSVGMRNNEAEFNCQNCVMAALKKLAEHGWLTNAQSEAGADGMIDGIMEAEDDEK